MNKILSAFAVLTLLSACNQTGSSCGLNNTVYEPAVGPVQYLQWVTYSIPTSLIQKNFDGKQGEFTIGLDVEIDANGKIWKKSGSAFFRIQGDEIQTLNARHPKSNPVRFKDRWMEPIIIEYPDEDAYKESFDYNITSCKLLW